MQKQRLSEDVILEVATHVIENIGAANFSMRKLATYLDTDPMAVYHYFRNKEAVIHGVLQRSMASIAIQVTGIDPSQDIMSLCHAFRGFALEHPQLLLLFSEHDPWLIAEHDLYEAFYNVFLRMGLSNHETVRMTRFFFTYLEEFCNSEIEGWHNLGDEEKYLESLGDSAYPSLRQMSRLTIAPYDKSDFEFGLKVLISGIEALRR